MTKTKPVTTAGGITRRLARVVLLQLLFISMITALGVIVAAKVVEDVMMKTALQGEAEHFWRNYQRDPSHPLPNTDNLLGYLDDSMDNREVPETLRDLAPGYGPVELAGNRVLLLVDRRMTDGREKTLYLVFDEESVAALSFYFGVVPLSLVLIVIYVSAWFAFRQARKAISPLVSLASRLRQFHSEDDTTVDLDIGQLKTGDPDDEINTLVDSLNAFTREINELIQRERRFTRDASHELRTPLAVIQGSAELLAGSGDLDNRQRRSVQRILRTTRDMNALVEALLLLARGKLAETGDEKVSLNEVIHDQLEQLRMTHNPDDGLAIHVIFRDEVVVAATRQLVDAICGNLLRNAFNYTREGQISVLLQKDCLEVANQGKDLAPPADSALFEPFTRGESSAGVEGYGVGLDIVRRLCEFYGWQVDGHFDDKRGMVFTIHLAA